MEVKLSWNVLADRMYTVAPTGKSREQLYALLFNKAARHSQEHLYEEKAHRGPAHKAVQAWWEQCQEWMLCYKCQCAPQDFKGFLHAFRGKEEDARAEVEVYGILRKEVADKRGHLPAQATTTLAWCERLAWARRCRSGHEGHLIFTWMAWMTTTGWKRCYEGLRGARFVSPFLRIFTGRFGGCWVGLCFLVCLLFFWYCQWKFYIQLAFHIFCGFPVVDRPCFVLAQQYRKKKRKKVW